MSDKIPRRQIEGEQALVALLADGDLLTAVTGLTRATRFFERRLAEGYQATDEEMEKYEQGKRLLDVFNEQGLTIEEIASQTERARFTEEVLNHTDFDDVEGNEE